MEDSLVTVTRLGWILSMIWTCAASSRRPEDLASGTVTCGCREEIEDCGTVTRSAETGGMGDQVLAGSHSLELWRTGMTSSDPVEAGMVTTCLISGTKASCLVKRSSWNTLANYNMDTGQ